jgi:hypothetical protein
MNRTFMVILLEVGLALLRLDGSTRGRINIFERWESQAARDTFRSSGPDEEQRGDAHGGGSGVHRRRAARVRRTHSMSCSTDRAMTDEIGAAVRVAPNDDQTNEKGPGVEAVHEPRQQGACAAGAPLGAGRRAA